MSDQMQQLMEKKTDMATDLEIAPPPTTTDCELPTNYGTPGSMSTVSEVPSTPMSLLPPDHPLLRKFQQALREHLLRAKEELITQIAEIQHNCKVKDEQRIESGARLYDLQEQLRQQHDQLEEYTNEISAKVEARRQHEEAVAALRGTYADQLTATKEQKTLYNRRMMEMEHTQQLENNLRKWTDEMEDEVKNAKRVVSRDAQLQKQLSEEKRKTDMLFLNLDVEVKRQEHEHKVVTDELQETRAAIEVLQTSISTSNTDLEVLQNEHKRLTQAWSEVIVAIAHRDKIIHQVLVDVGKEKENIKLSTSGVAAIKKQIAKETEQNQKLASFKTRLITEFGNLKRECQKELEALSGLEEKLELLPTYLEQTEKDMTEARREGTNLETEVRRIQRKLDKQYIAKFTLEEDILKLAQEQLITDKASQYRLKLLNNSQDQRRRMELAMTQAQNQLAQTLFDLESMKGSLVGLRQENEQYKAKLNVAEKRVDNLQAEMKMMETQIELKIKRIDRLSVELEKLVRMTEDNEACTTDLKIKAVEKSLQVTEQDIREQQQFWLLLQNHFVHLSQKRSHQLNEIQLTRKQLSIIKQKSLRIDGDLETTETKTNDLTRDIHLYTVKIGQLNDKVFRKRQQHESDEVDCELGHADHVHRLKDNEMRVLELEGEIDGQQIELEQLKDLVLEKHREALSWETKYKLIDETLRWRKQEKHLDSEIETMKFEIHRMQIRHNQLKRAQEKLVQDLDHCVMHREQIFVAATNRQRIESQPRSQRCKATASTRQKLTELRNKLKLTQNEIGSVEDRQVIEAQQALDKVNDQVERMHKSLQLGIEEDDALNTQIEQSILLKHYNLEVIVRKQNRAKAYRRLSAHTEMPPKLPRSEATIDLQAQKQADINDHLLNIVQTLNNDFPEHKMLLTRISQLLQN